MKTSVCGAQTLKHKSCRRKVKQEDEFCFHHKPQIAAGEDSLLFSEAMNKALIKELAFCGNLQLMQELVKWYLWGAEQESLDDKTLAEWLLRGMSVNNGKSFKEIYGKNPMFVLVTLPQLKPFKKPLLELYKHLALTKRGRISVDWQDLKALLKL